jgi:murein L,D-transpeptidase YcbB/YkuD
VWSGTALSAHAAPPAPDDQQEVEAAAEDIVLSPVARELQTRLANAKGFTSKPDKKLIADIRTYYEARQYQPVWFRYGDPIPQIDALKAAMAQARRDALDPADYVMPDTASGSLNNIEAIAEAEFAATMTIIRYANHLAAGRIRPRSLSRHVTREPEKPEPGDILEKLSTATDMGAALRAYEPKHEQYWALKRKLAELMAKTDEADQPEIPGGRVLRHGSHDPRVVLLRERLGVEVVDGGDPELFDRPLLNAVKAFQRKNALGADGIVGRGTLSVLNRDNRASTISVISANIERWRWMPRTLGEFHVAVNIPEFTVRVNRAGKTVHSTRVVVGKRSNPTPVFSDEMEHLIVNPYWNVPSSILSNEMLPDIMIDPTGYFSRHGYEVLARGYGQRGMRPVHPEMVDWFTVDPKSVLVRQRPGKRNALGRIKFMFPNRHAVYLHDTPSKNLFERNSRAFSHGCVRVKDPLAFADAILVNEPEWNSKRLKRMFGGRERKVDLSTHIPVHLTYFTASVGADGTIDMFGDIYGYDRAIRKLTAR